MTGTTIAQAIPIAISPILTRIYTPKDFGVFTLFLAITGLFSVIVSGRYELALMLPRKDEDAINIFALGLMIVIVLSLFFLILVTLLHESIVNILNNEEIGYWLYFIPLALFFMGLFNLLSYYNNRKKNYQDIARATIIKSIILAMAQLGLGFVKAGASGLITGQIISTVFANIHLFKNIMKDKILLSKISLLKIIALAKRYKDFPKYQAPHAMLNVSSSNMPIYIFTPFFGLSVVGMYSLSTRIIITPMMILAGASAKVYTQKVTQIYNENGDSYGFTIRLLISLFKKIILPFLLIIFFAPEIFSFVFGDNWREAGVYTQILFPWLLLNILVSTVSFIPSLVNMQRKAFNMGILLLILTTLFILIGVFFNHVYLTLFLFMLANSIVLIYNLSWMLNALRR